MIHLITKIIVYLYLLLISISVYPFIPGTILSVDGIPGWIRVYNHKYIKNIFNIKINDNNFGTGFIISDDANYIVTNAHIALSIHIWDVINETVAVNEYGKIKIKYIEYIDKKHDFALLGFEWINKNERLEKIKITEKNELPLIGEKVYVIGFSYIENGFVLSKGFITDTEYTRDKKPCFMYDADTIEGMSGSPVFNSDDELIALHYGSPEKNINNAVPFLFIEIYYKSGTKKKSFSHLKDQK